MNVESCLKQRRALWYLAAITSIAFYLLTAASSAFAQLPTGTILGVVKDPSGAVIAGATVTSRNVDTGVARTSPTEADGSYRFPALPTGNYEVEVSHEGFETTKQSGITLSVGQEAVVNIALQVGSTSQTVEVTAEAPIVNTTNGTLGTVVNEEKIADLPLNGRNYQELSLLQPGITRLEVGVGQTVGGGTFEFSSNGAPVRSNSYLLDGTPLVNIFSFGMSSVAGTTLGMDGVKEFRVVTNSFGAEYGLVMGSVMTVVTKGGTNAFHGDVFEYFRNSAMDAANFFDPTSIDFPGERIAPLRRNQFGGSVGGPIKKDKTFFYATYEGLRQKSGTSDILSTFNTNCYSPTTHLLLTTGNPCASATRAGAPPLGTVAAAIQPFLQFFPYPNLPPATGSSTPRFGVVFLSPIQEDFGEIRIDQNFSSTDSFFGRYTIDDAVTSTATNPLFVATDKGKNQFATFAETHIFSPVLLNTARFSVSSFPIVLNANTPGAPPCSFTHDTCISSNSNPGTSLVCSTLYGTVTGTPPTGTGCLEMGSISITGISGLAYPFTNQEEALNTISGSDDLFYTKGKHSFKFGTLINRYQENIGEFIGQAGSLSFTGIGASPAATSPVANFFAGLANSTSLLDPAHSQGNKYYRFFSFGFYGQDDIRLTSRLTLNVGLRYEPDTVPNEKFGNTVAFLHLSTTDTANSFVPGPPFRNPSLKNFSPRVGFAWDIFGDGKTSLRGGFAELYDIGNIGSAMFQEIIGLPPFTQSANTTAPTGQVIKVALPLVVPASYSPTLHLVSYFQNQPHLLQYNLSIERQLPGQLALTISYAGSHGSYLWDQEDANPKAPEPGSLTTWPIAGNTLFTTQHMNPNLSSVTDFSTLGDSSYNALQVGVQKRLSHNLQFQSSYTYSKDLDDGQAQLGSEGFNTDPFVKNVDRGPANWDVRHYWRFNLIYTLPDVTHEKILSGIVNGWRVSMVEAVSSGYPFTPTMNSNVSGSGVNNGGSGVDRPSWNPAFTGNLYPHTIGEWFNPAAFMPAVNGTSSTGPVGTLGDVGRNALRGPGLTNTDVSLVKEVKLKPLGEAGGLEIRVDSFNIFNHPNFATPASNAAFPTPGTAGQISSTAPNADSRRMQLALKILF